MMGYFPLPRSPELEPHHQMQYITRTPLFCRGAILLICNGYSSPIQSLKKKKKKRQGVFERDVRLHFFVKTSDNTEILAITRKKKMFFLLLFFPLSHQSTEIWEQVKMECLCTCFFVFYEEYKKNPKLRTVKEQP